MLKIPKHLKDKNRCTSYHCLPTVRLEEVQGQDHREIQASICIIFYHQHLASKPVKEGIVIPDDRSCHMTGHDLAPS
jgi:hypothetical protein